MSLSDFTPPELLAGLVISTCVALGTPISARFLHGQAQAGKAKPEARAQEVPMEVTPVLDELPLLKLGGKKMRAKLPDMWQVKPEAVKRFEAASAPSPQAKDDPKAIPETPVIEGDAAAPPPDAEVAKEVDEDIKQMDAGETPEPQVEGEGSPDGVKEGTETDPLKARAVSLYRQRIAAWFSSRFREPTDIPCEVLGGLRASVSASVGGDRSVTGFTITSPSGNASFDARVQQTMQGTIGQQLPPPPKNYPDILGGTVFPVFTGTKKQCAASPSPSPAPNPDTPEAPTPEAPAPAPAPEPGD
ncbi:MAG: energy transducer TonB [Polyangiaceae bacterium]|nr:energy transducer TonB [Polyangiaceae bacterium]MCW5789942.1 energy transducer TonB [Polyangiaceae bacterium]